MEVSFSTKSSAEPQCLGHYDTPGIYQNVSFPEIVYVIPNYGNADGRILRVERELNHLSIAPQAGYRHSLVVPVSALDIHLKS